MDLGRIEGSLLKRITDQGRLGLLEWGLVYKAIPLVLTFGKAQLKEKLLLLLSKANLT
jgi:hypothetical protein